MFWIGFFIGGMLLTRIAVLVIELLLLLILRGSYKQIVFTAVGLTGGLIVCFYLFSSRPNGSNGFEQLLIYAVCLAIWLGLDYLFANFLENRKLRTERI